MPHKLKKWAYLPGNNSTASPTTICFVDTETWDKNKQFDAPNQEHTLRLGCATLGRLVDGVLTRRKELDFTDATQFWEYVFAHTQERVPTWIFCHNWAFDSKILDFWGLFTDGTLTFKGPPRPYKNDDGEQVTSKGRQGFACLECPPLIVDCYTRDGKHLIIVDTLNYWVTSLEKIGESVSCPKLTMPAMTATDTEWFAYCRGDVNVLEKAVCTLVNWVKTNDLGKFRFSVPSQAMAAFRHRLSEHKICLHTEDDVKLLERESYYGGRLECFYIGEVKEKVYELDVASLYPSVMKGNLYPTKLTDWVTAERCFAGQIADDANSCIARVSLCSPTGDFPLRCKLGTIYPTGSFETTLAGPELMRALNNGYIQQVLAFATYDLAPIFDKYVDYFWGYRKEQELAGNKTLADLAKLMLNSLYGKFGQQTSEWKDIGECDDFEPWEHNTIILGDPDNQIEYRCIGRLLQHRQKPEEHPFAFPAIAAFVTSYARDFMYKLRQIAGTGNVYYISTDALYCNEAGYQNLVTARYVSDRELGRLTVKHSADEATFTTLHNYRLGERVCKGSVKKRAVLQSDGSYNELHFEGLSKNFFGTPTNTVKISTVNKHVNTHYSRGRRGDDGWITPLCLPDDNKWCGIHTEDGSVNSSISFDAP